MRAHTTGLMLAPGGGILASGHEILDPDRNLPLYF